LVNHTIKNPLKTQLFFFLAACTCFLPSAGDSTTLTLTDKQFCDLEMILVDGFSPLKGFLGKEDYDSVVETMRLASGALWPIPIVLDINRACAKTIKIGDKIQLNGEDGSTYAILHVSHLWTPDKEKEAINVFGTLDKSHPGVRYLFEETNDIYIGGPITATGHLKHYAFQDLRKTPHELKSYFKSKGFSKVIGFQTRNPMHKAHIALTQMATKATNAHLLIHPVVGKTKEGDIDPYTRVRCYRKALQYFPQGSATLSVLPLAMRMGGPREALWHAIIRKNYGCTHFIVGRDHAGPGNDAAGKVFYEPYAAQALVKKHASEIGIEIISVPEMVFVQERNQYLPINEISPGITGVRVSGTELRRRLRLGLEIPDFFSFPEIIEELRSRNPPLSKQGITLFITGLSGSGKSTIARALREKLSEIQHRPITVLDGDIIRQKLIPNLGFSEQDRSLNVRCVGFIASEITKNGGLAICAMIAPYEHDRKMNRTLIENTGNYIEIYLSTPLEICEKRDVKGLYAKARQGVITQFTGIDDPYEVPLNPECSIDTSAIPVENALDQIIRLLSEKKLITEF